MQRPENWVWRGTDEDLIPGDLWAGAEYQRGMTHDKWNQYIEVQRTMKKEHLPENKSLSSLLVGKWGGAESQRGMMQDKIELEWIFLTKKMELFSWCWELMLSPKWWRRSFIMKNKELCLVPRREDEVVSMNYDYVALFQRKFREKVFEQTEDVKL